MSSVLWRAPVHPALQAGVRELTDADRGDVVALAARDPIVNAVIGARLSVFPTLDARQFGGAVLGLHDHGGGLVAAAFNGGNLLPIGGGHREWTALARHLADRRRACSSIVGRAEAVTAMWSVLAGTWGPARAIRAAQPLLVLDRAPGPHLVDPRLRTMRLPDLDAYLPAAAAMFTEELGVSPMRCVGLTDYRRRVGDLVRGGRAFGVLDRDGSVLFKADLGAISPQTCQVQGVWVRPDLRGRGLGTAALAGVLRHALTLAPTVSLYVNDFNLAARRMYARLGMRQVATLSTVLF